MRFKNKIAVITGGNSGIGKAIASEFAKEGAKVIILGRNKNTINETVNEIGNLSKGYQVDVTDVKAVSDTFKNIHENFGKIDILALNAGYAHHMPTSQMTEEIFDTTMNTNVKGPYFTLQKALPYLNDGASIVATSSVSSLLGIEAMGVYAGSKAALNRMMLAFAAEFSQKTGIRFNIVSPGYTKTPIFDELIAQDTEFVNRSVSAIPARRFADPLEIAHAVLFLSSDEAKYINGANLNIDGGLSSIYNLKKLQTVKDESTP